MCICGKEKNKVRKKRTITKYEIKHFLKQNRGTIIFYMILFAVVIYGVISISAVQKNKTAKLVYTYEGPEANVDASLESKYNKIATSEHVELHFDEAKGNIKVLNTKTGYEWSSIVTEEIYPISKLNKQWNAYVQSSFTISYNDLAKRDAPPATLYSSRDCDFREVSYIDNGVQVKYGFTTVGIFITIQYTVEDGTLKVRIPYEGYEELLNYVVTNVELLPYFGAAGDDIKGYLLYPDGNGAITKYENVSTRSSKVKQGILRNYSDKKLTVESFLYGDNIDRYFASMPILGIKNGNNGLFAAVTNGEEEVGITTYPSGIVVDLNRINFDFYTRNLFDVSMSISSGSDEMNSSKEIQRVDEHLIEQDREVTYFFLDGDEASYSGMANTYRNYLLGEGKLVDAIEDGEKLPLALQFYMGTTEEQMLGVKYIPMTTFENATEMLESLKSKGIDSAELVIASWQKDGVNYPEYWPMDSEIGGKKGMKDFNDYIKANPGINAYLHHDYLFAIKEVGGFSATDDIVYSGINLPISAGFDRTWYMLNPGVVKKHAVDFLDKIESYDAIGAGYGDIGYIIYPDYNKNAPYTRQETVKEWVSILEEAKNKNKGVALDGTNQYTFAHSDYFYGVSLDSYGLAITDHDVPFITMVLSGLVPMSGKAGNLSYDLDIQKLEWIENGTLPYFLLTYEDAVRLKETDSNSIFSSTFSKWEDRVVEVYKEFEDNFASVYGKQITLHEHIGDGIVQIGYEDGTLVYINYNDEEVKVNNITVAAKDYCFVSQEGR